MDSRLDTVAKELWQILEARDPAQWRKCCPRTYTETKGRFVSPKAPSREMMGIAKKVKDGYLGASEKVECVCTTSSGKVQ